MSSNTDPFHRTRRLRIYLAILIIATICTGTLHGALWWMAPAVPPTETFRIEQNTIDQSVTDALGNTLSDLNILAIKATSDSTGGDYYRLEITLAERTLNYIAFYPDFRPFTAKVAPAGTVNLSFNGDDRLASMDAYAYMAKAVLAQAVTAASEAAVVL